MGSIAADAIADYDRPKHGQGGQLGAQTCDLPAMCSLFQDREDGFSSVDIPLPLCRQAHECLHERVVLPHVA